MIDYVLTSAVSLTAGVAAIASAFPGLWPYRVPMALAILMVILLANLRGAARVRTAMSVPVYLFLLTFGAMVVAGIVVAIREGQGSWDSIPVTGSR